MVELRLTYHRRGEDALAVVAPDLRAPQILPSLFGGNRRHIGTLFTVVKREQGGARRRGLGGPSSAPNPFGAGYAVYASRSRACPPAVAADDEPAATADALAERSAE